MVLKLQRTIDGTSKAEMCDWWLAHIESEVDDYLENFGYVLSSLPENYTDRPPDDLDLVRSNFQILVDLPEVFFFSFFFFFFFFLFYFIILLF